MGKYLCLEAQLDDSSNNVKYLSEMTVSPTCKERPFDEMNKNALLAHLLKTSVPNGAGNQQQKIGYKPNRQRNINDSQLFQQLVIRDKVKESEPLKSFPTNFGHNFHVHVLPPITQEPEINSHSQWTKIPNSNLVPQPNVNSTCQDLHPVRSKRLIKKPRKLVQKPAVITTEEVRARVERNQGIRILQQPIRCSKRSGGFEVTLSDLLKSKRLSPVPPPSLVSTSPVFTPIPSPDAVVTSTVTTTRQVSETNSKSTQTEASQVIQPEAMQEQAPSAETELKKELYLFKVMIANLQRTIGELTQENKALQILAKAGCWRCGYDHAFNELKIASNVDWNYPTNTTKLHSHQSSSELKIPKKLDWNYPTKLTEVHPNQLSSEKIDWNYPKTLMEL